MPSVAPTGGRDLLAIVAALDALEDGDVRLAVEILLAALEDGPYVVRSRCRFCGAGFPWPGLLDSHLRAVHFDEEEVERAA